MIGEITKNVYSLNKSWSLLVSIEKSRYNANIGKMITIIKTVIRDPYIAMKFSFEVAYSWFTPGIGMKLDKMMIVNRILVTRVHF